MQTEQPIAYGPLPATWIYTVKRVKEETQQHGRIYQEVGDPSPAQPQAED